MENKQFFEAFNVENKIFDEISQESQEIGYYNLPEQNIDTIVTFASKVVQKNIVIVGIGGSSLGTGAVYDFLRYKNKF